MDFAPHFTRQEIEHSDTAVAHGLANTCPPELVETLAQTSWLAEEARGILGGKPLAVTSGFRSAAVNAIVAQGSTSTGVHPLALAVDVVPPEGMTLGQAFEALQADSHFMQQIDQLIIEEGCIHLGRPRPGQTPRHQLRASKWERDANGKLVRHYPSVGTGVWIPGQVQHA